MRHVTGLGGVFVKSPDPARLMEWYRTRLGVETDACGARFDWRERDDPETVGHSLWGVFAQDTRYFDPSDRPFMVNLRVNDLDALLAELRAAGERVDERIDDSEFGRFGWVIDPDGTRVELWQPPAADTPAPVREAVPAPKPGAGDASLTIHAAVPGDEAVLLQLIRELATYERLSEEVEATEERLREALFGAGCSAEAVLAREGDLVVGFALWFHNFSTFVGRRGLYLEDLYVRPAFRGRGYGVALMRHLAGIAVARGCGRMEWAALNWNTRAADFYGRLGARRMDQWTVFRWDGQALEQVARSWRR